MHGNIKVIVLTFLCICPLCFASEPNSVQEGEQNVFSGSYAEAIWTVLTFLLLLLILGKIAWKPMLAGLKNRQERIQDDLNKADKARKEAEKALALYNTKIGLIEEECRQIAENIRKQAEKESRLITQKAQNEVSQLKQKAEEDIIAARSEAKRQFIEEAGDIVASLSGQLLGRVIDSAENQKLIHEAVAKLKDELGE